MLTVTYFTDNPIIGVQEALEKMLQQKVNFKQYPLKQVGSISNDISIANESDWSSKVVGTFFVRQDSIYHIRFTYIHLIHK